MPNQAIPTRMALIVDDSMLIRHTVCRFFEEHGFVVESATNGIEALEILKRVRPHLVVTDMQMPKMGGRELISQLKQDPQNATIPIVVLAGRHSGFDPNEDRADFTIYKDIDIEEQLGKALKSTFGKRGKAAQAAR